ncbi:MAG: hypothetical protein MUE96_06695 [Bacteroidia bacterium]|jgi:hypothetical protein|nr:hypothetical protein [Bacteroidia bacterium]
MKKAISAFIILAVLVSANACKPQQCKRFDDPRNSYHVKYDKKGLVKSKNKNRSNWSNR